MTSRRLDEAQLILIAAVASRTTPDAALAAADLSALARVVVAMEELDDILEIAAAALVEIARERPFGPASNAAAWLACALLAPADAEQLAADRSEALDLVARASSGEATREQVRERLASRRTRCPACRRTLGRGGTAGPRRAVRPTPIELVARCAVEHRAHGRFGQPFRAPTREEDTPWRPVVTNPLTGAMIVLADAAPLLLVPRGERYDVIEARFVAGDLVGDWRALTDRAVVVASIAAGAVVLDADRSMIDTSRLDERLRRLPAFA